MKTIILAALLCSVVGFTAGTANAKPKKVKTPMEKICESLQDEVFDNCTHSMCDDLIADGTYENMGQCVGGADYAEAAQAVCEDNPTLEDLVQDYNKQHPKNKIRCEE